MKSLLISSSQQEQLIRNETERRRTLRLLQTRQIEKQRAAQLRQTIAEEKTKQTYVLLDQLKTEWIQEKIDLHDNLEYQFRENLMEMGKGHKDATEQPDFEQEWLTKTLENDAKAIERGQQALDKLHVDMMQNENERNLHILHRKAALELERIRAQQMAALPPPEDPLRDLQTKPTTIVTVHDPYNFTTTRYHLEERLVTKEDDIHGDAAQDAIVEQERIDTYVSDKQRLWNEQQEKARVRGDNALKREVLDNAYDNVLDELGKLERQDRDRRQKEIQNLPKSIFIPPWRREEEREERQRQMETAFEQAYQDTHKKEPIPIVLMNENDVIEEEGEGEEQEDVASDRTLVAQDEQEEPTPEYRFATVTPTVNTVPVADEVHEDEEATLADPTLITLQTPLPEQQQLVKQQQQQQNMRRLIEKIERQRQAAQNRASQQASLATPTIKTPKRLIVSPGYIESSTSVDSSVTPQNMHDEQTSENNTTAEIEERRIQLESRKQALEEQIRMLSQRANTLPQQSICPIGSSSSDLSIESLLKNLRTASNTTSIPSTTSSMCAGGKRHEDDHEQFAQAVQAIVTSDESQLQSSSSGIAIEEDERSHATLSDDTNKGRFLLDKYESHSSEDRDQSLEELISRLVATQQQPQSISKSNQNQSIHETKSMNTQTANTSFLIDDLVDDALSSVSSMSIHTPVDQRSESPEVAHLLLLNRNADTPEQLCSSTDDESRFYEEKRLIEQELELIRRERENLLNEHEKYRQQALMSSMKQQTSTQTPPPPSLLRTKLNIASKTDVHELSTIQEVDTPVSSRNTSLFHHRSPLKSSFDLQQLERISSADSSLASENNDILPLEIPTISLIQLQQQQQQQLQLQQQQQQQQLQLISNTGLERDDSGISLIDGPRSSATSRTTLGGGNGGGGRSSSSGIQSLLTTRQPRVRTITNETTATTNTSTSANLPVVITTPRSNTESDDQSLSSVSKKWRDILANECVAQSSTSFNTMNRNDQPQLTHSLGFGSSNIEEILPSSTSNNNQNALLPSSQSLPTQEQILRSQYDNEQCDLMSLIKVHEYLTKQQHPSSTLPNVEQLMPVSSTPPIHHQSHSTLTSVTYRSSIAKQVPTSGAAISSTPSHASFSSADLPIHQLTQGSREHRTSIVSDIHHLTRSPNTFETSITSNSSSNSNKPQDTLSYLIEQNQLAMQRLISNNTENALTAESTFLSATSVRAVDHEIGPSGIIPSAEKVQQSPQLQQQQSILVEIGPLSIIDFQSTILGTDEQKFLEPINTIDCRFDADDRGILDEPSLTLLSNSYRSLTTTAACQYTTAAPNQSVSQKKKQCSSPLSNYDDKTSACSTPSLSPIKNEPLLIMNKTNRQDISTPLQAHVPPISQQSPLLPFSSINSSTHYSLEKPKHGTSSNDTSLLSFERHELSAGNLTVMTNDLNDNGEHKLNRNISADQMMTVIAPSTMQTTADWSYFVTVGKELPKDIKTSTQMTLSSSSSSSSFSSSSSSISKDHNNSEEKRLIGGLEFFIDGQQSHQDSSTTGIIQLPSLQSALKARRADFVATSQKRVDEIKAKDYTKATSSLVSMPTRSNSRKQTARSVSASASSSKIIVETDSEERQRRSRESKERSKRLYDQLAEVKQKKKFNETKQQAQAYRARMNAFQAELDKKKTHNNNNNNKKS